MPPFIVYLPHCLCFSFTNEQPGYKRKDYCRSSYQNIIKNLSDLPPLAVQRILTCILCGMQTNSQSKMLEHMEFHSNSEPVLSSDEEEYLNLEIPLLTIIDEDVECSRQSDFKKSLWKKYKLRSRSLKPKYCGLCQSTNRKVFPHFSKPDLARHYLFFHSRRAYSCLLCSNNFRHKYQVYLHYTLKHNSNYFRFIASWTFSRDVWFNGFGTIILTQLMYK